MPDGKFNRRLKLRRLLDRWNIGAVILICILKILQYIKKMGFKVEESGWRKFAGIFLRKEHSKFILSVFRLKYCRKINKPKNFDEAKDFLIKKLAVFLREHASYHWCFEYSLFRARRKRIYFTDITETVFSESGKLEKIIPYFDETRVSFAMLSERIKRKALRKIVIVFNQNEKKRVGDVKRAKVISGKLRRWAWKVTGITHTGRQDLFDYIDRILTSTFIHFEELTGGDLLKERLKTPYMQSKRHPGFGLLNVVCRFTPSYKEADLWVQYHHVPVDGMPMEELLETLKKQWGVAGKIKFPALKDASPEIRYHGDGIYRGRIFVHFEKILKLRKYLNEKYLSEMEGAVTIPGMIIWGLAQREYFKDTKFVITTDLKVEDTVLQDRNLGLVFIRPGDYNKGQGRLKDFLEFQRELNSRIYLTKNGKSETNELLDIYAMVHPSVILAVGVLLPRAVKEVVGTAGITVLKNTEIFISPLTDLQVRGFVSIGNMKVETEDGKTAGAVSFCAKRKQVREYIKGFRELTNNYHRFLEIEEPDY
ncbi:MAG: hypothetical protein K9M56_03380 [Victivallales bacterium]|nr:hypothetical protein [Victivallales bacterium]